MPLPAIATALLSAAPAIVKLFTGDGDKDKGAAEQVAEIAKSVAGTDDQDSAVKAINEDPQLALKLRESVNELRIAELEQEREKLQTVNRTMRAEYETGANAKNFWQFLLALWKTGWRPYWGWISGTAFGAWIAGVLYLIYRAIEREGVGEAVELASSIGTLVTQMLPLFAIALTVLGVSVAKRSGDKRATQTGQPPKGLLEQLAGLFGGKQ